MAFYLEKRIISGRRHPRPSFAIRHFGVISRVLPLIIPRNLKLRTFSTLRARIALSAILKSDFRLAGLIADETLKLRTTPSVEAGASELVSRHDKTSKVGRSIRSFPAPALLFGQLLEHNSKFHKCGLDFSCQEVSLNSLFFNTI